MTPPNSQPTLPAEGAYTDLEQLFIEEQPKNLWPTNQNSNFGALRRVLTGKWQEGVNLVAELSSERFVETSLAAGYLGRWEAEVGLPVAPAGRTEVDRRSLVKGRLRKGAFTRSRMREILESHVTATFGAPTELTPAGVPLTPAGATLFSEGGPVTSLYRIYEDVKNFSYEVRINPTVTVDQVSLQRELQRITPAWINFTIVSGAVLDYAKMVKNDQPAWHSRLAGNADDTSGYANHGVLNGAPVSLASPGLLVNPAGGSSAAYDLDGVDDFISIAHASQLNLGDNLTIEFWMRLDGTPGTSYTIIQKAGAFKVTVDSSRRILLDNDLGTSIVRTNALSTGVIYHVVIRKSPTARSIWVNGALNLGTDFAIPVTLLNTITPIRWGASTPSANFFNGPLDEPALYDRNLPDTKITEHYNTGRNIA